MGKMKKFTAKGLIVALSMLLLLSPMSSLAFASNNNDTSTTNLLASSKISDSLQAKIGSNSSTRVIVQLTGQYSLERSLSGAQVTLQKKLISTKQNQIVSHLNSVGGLANKKTTTFSTIPYMALNVNATDLAALKSDANVASITEDVVVTLDADQLAAAQEETASPQLAATNQVMHTQYAWDAGYTGSGTAVAVVDTGVDKTHPFLTGKVVSEACYAASGCPDGSTSSTAPGSATPANTSSGPHGTHVAGIVAGKNSTMSGVAKDASIIAINVFGNGNGAYTSDIIAGLERVYALRTTYNIASINMSLGGSRYYSNCDSSPAKSIIDQLKAAGIATIIASGNSGYKDSMAWPACISSAVSVGATTNSDTVASFSNSASFLSMLAPGNPVYSSIPNGQYAYYSGTSMATPQVAGGYALFKQKNPNKTVDQIVALMKNAGTSVTDTNGIAKPRLDFTTFDTSLPKLAKVDKPTWNGKIVQWSSVANASSYEVKLYNGAQLVTTQSVAANVSQFDCSSYMGVIGDYKVTVQAIGNNVSYQSGQVSDGAEFVYPQLAKVDKPTWNGNFIQWNSIANASTYEVKLYDDAQWVSTKSVPADVTQQDFTSEMNAIGQYTVTVQAMGDGISYRNGEVSSASTTLFKGAVYVENFENNDGGFTTSGSFSTWVWGAPKTGPNAAYSGSNVWATNLIGDYSNYEKSAITSPTIDLSKATAPITLQWKQYAATERNWDYYSVDISNDGGLTWTPIVNRDHGDIDLVWTNHEVELDSSYAVSNFKIRYRLSADESITRAGIYIDDIIISGDTSAASQLDQVQQPVWDNDVIQWDEIANASGYALNLYYNSELQSTTQVDNINTEYDFSADMNEPGIYTVTVQALGNQSRYTDGEVSVPSESRIKQVTLAQVDQPVWSDEVISWSAVEDAIQYEVNVYKSGVLVHTETVDAASIDYDFSWYLSDHKGTYTATVKALGDDVVYLDGDTSDPSEPYTNLTVLAQVAKPTWSGDSIVWKDVALETQYEVKLYRGENVVTTKRVNSNVVKLNLASSMSSPGAYKVTVQAIGDHTTTEDGLVSELSASNIKTFMLRQVAKPTWNKDVIKWTAVSNVSSYEVKLYRGSVLVATKSVSPISNQYNWASFMKLPGSYKVTVRSMGDGVFYLHGLVSVYSDVRKK